MHAFLHTAYFLDSRQYLFTSHLSPAHCSPKWWLKWHACVSQDCMAVTNRNHIFGTLFFDGQCWQVVRSNNQDVKQSLVILRDYCGIASHGKGSEVKNKVGVKWYHIHVVLKQSTVTVSTLSAVLLTRSCGGPKLGRLNIFICFPGDIHLRNGVCLHVMVLHTMFD